ncbi:WGR domain-containing protein [Polyangium aurulentum]|uniref:WGR domain-containing protein n=1 Tax=Polyangium aurulentum TaxID=2567896 RepID=UPI0010AE91A1|nr:WGR domain-containing protein [Polyangium aurulentum]UQA55765.1 WGR domain-containing protein [Polyangium aurulentum]
MASKRTTGGSASEKTYLELSEDGGGAHKFYEVTVAGASVTIRYGRIGDAGQTQAQKLANADEAKAFAQKKINEKTKKGYAPAVMGERQKRSVTRRPIVSKAPPSNAKRAPVLWKFASGSPAFGIFIDEKLSWVGNQKGEVHAVTRDGKVEASFKLPDGVKCIIADEDWRYAGCDDGNVYDLGSGGVPRLAYEIHKDVDIFWLDIHEGTLCVSDDAGGVNLFDHESELRWKKKSKGSSGWMIRADASGIYHGHSDGVTKYDWKEGKALWSQKTKGAVLFGWQEGDFVYAGASDDKLYMFTKSGKAGPVFQCDDSVWSCATSPGGKYVFAGDSSSSIYCFDDTGKRLWKLATGCETACSMQYRNDKLYIVTYDGTLACIDASEAAIKAAQEGQVPKAVDIKAPKAVAIPTTQLETTRDTKKGVVVECYAQGGKLRVRVVSPGFDKKRNCQFPRDIREAGARFVVDEVRESTSGGFYRALGKIRRLEA